MRAELERLVGADAVLPGDTVAYLEDATAPLGLRGHADAIVLPRTAEEVARVVAWCYERGIAIVPRGGGTGFAGGAVPFEGGVVIALERLARVRALDPLAWRAQVEAGVPTAQVRRLARESGLYVPPDPGAAEQSQIGGNVATNAGGPHAFKYGVTGRWVTGIEAVVAPGELVTVGGPIRKDQSGYDLRGLLVGSEGTLGIITAVWLRLVPAPEAAHPVVAFFDSTASGCEAIERVLGSGLVPAAVEYLDGATLAIAAPAFPGCVPRRAGFMLLTEADGTREEAARLRSDLAEVLGETALAVRAPESAAEIAELWRWREGIALAATAKHGGKLGEDIAVPVDRLADAIEGVLAIGGRLGLEALSFGHAGDGNLHANFLFDPGAAGTLERARAAAGEAAELGVSLGGSVSGEHGLGWLKRGQLARQWGPRALELHASVKQAFDPKGLFNPGKKS
ncbi:MAG: FAD-binding protein [Thermoleophilia bacterium]|nr:FAD-binding protein [Thermoleophilia bacterium]